MIKRENLLLPMFLSIFLSLGVVSSSAFADKFEHNEKRMERLAEKLSLTDDQAQAFQTVMEGQAEKRRAFMEAHKAETLDNLSSVLDSEQLTKFEEMMERRKKGQGGKHQKHHS